MFEINTKIRRMLVSRSIDMAIFDSSLRRSFVTIDRGLKILLVIRINLIKFLDLMTIGSISLLSLASYFMAQWVRCKN